MRIQFLRAGTAALLAALTLAGAASAADSPAAVNKWHVLFNGTAENDGQLQFRMTPHEGEAVNVTIDIKRGRGVMFIARDVCDAFKSQLPKKRFKSEVFSDNQVLVKAGPGESEFALELMGSDVPGTRVQVNAN